MKYRRYYQRVLKDRLTALRKVWHGVGVGNVRGLDQI